MPTATTVISTSLVHRVSSARHAPALVDPLADPFVHFRLDPADRASAQRDRPGEAPLWGNKLKGPIPPELGNLESLEDADLSDNILSGPQHGNGRCFRRSCGSSPVGGGRGRGHGPVRTLGLRFPGVAGWGAQASDRPVLRGRSTDGVSDPGRSVAGFRTRGHGGGDAMARQRSDRPRRLAARSVRLMTAARPRATLPSRWDVFDGHRQRQPTGLTLTMTLCVAVSPRGSSAVMVTAVTPAATPVIVSASPATPTVATRALFDLAP